MLVDAIMFKCGHTSVFRDIEKDELIIVAYDHNNVCPKCKVNKNETAI